MFLDNFEIPKWVEWLACILIGMIFGAMFALGV